MELDEAVAIRLIGEVRVVHGGHVVHPRVVGGARCVEVLAYLAVNRHREIPQDELAGLLWSDNRPQSWNAALRGVLSRVRDTMELAAMPAGSVRSRGGNVRLSLPDGFMTDIELVRRYCAAPDADLGVAVANARRALDLTAAPALAGAAGAWADDVRTETQHLRRRALEIDASGSLTLGEPARAIASAEGLLALDPLRESAYRTAMSGYLALGERGQALQVAARCRQILDDELGVAPSAETESLYLQILRADEPDSAVPGSALAGSGVPSPTIDIGDDFVGRGAELVTITEAIGRADRGRGQFVVVAGEAGSGKTTIALEVMRRAHAAGAHILFGRCSDEAVVPFEPFVEAVGRELDALGMTEARQWLRSNGTDILRLVPNAVRRFGEMAPARTEVDERAVIMTAVLDWLTSPVRSGPTVLVIDDLHWASAATLAVIRYLIHASEQSRLCVVATVRDELADGADIRATLAAPTRSSGVQRLHLGGFSLAEIGALVDAADTALDPVTLYERTDGLPLFVASLIGSYEPGAGGTLPASVAESVAQRERLLSPAALVLLQLCSVVGMVSQRLVLRSVASDLDDIAFADALDELVRNRLVTENPTETKVRLRHPLVQEAVYEGVTGRRRAEMHTRVARTSEHLGGVTAAEDYSRLAYHFSRGLDSERPRAAEFSRRAGDSAMSIGAYEDAVVFYTSAAEQLLPRGDSAQRCRLLVDLGRAQRKARDPAFRPTLFDAVTMAKRLGDTELQVTATLANDQPGTLYVHIHSDHERIDTLYDALHVLESDGHGDGSAAARLLAQLAIELLWLADSRVLRDLLTRSIGAARVSGDQEALVAALSAVLVALRAPLCTEMRRAAYTELMTVLDDSPARRVDALMSTWIARNQIEYGHLTAAARTRSGLTPARVSRDPELAWLVRNIDFSIDLAAGRLQRCESTFDALRDIPASPAVTYTYGRLLGQLFALRTLRGDMSEIVAAADGIIERLDIVDTYRVCLATAYVDVGNRGAAVELVDWYDRRRINEIPRNHMWLATIATIGRAAAQVGNAEVCQIAYDLLLDHSGESTITWASIYGVVDHHLTELAIALGRFDRAAAHLDVAFTEHERRGFMGWYAETAYLATLLEVRRDGQASDATIGRARRLADDVAATAVRRRIDALRPISRPAHSSPG
ncbi:ATP-binding protein [Williamsia maris]|uniref:Transcriptional activator domain-containing protein n=1 Tax=Williamsia maris TaxID=72806 RepID=A0ABT1HEC0_9NOCA|nr:AAA family ATPase [Williamsia maris]MCP2176602.1 transcriptional activator domain-containing protein [Williamsia maris]